MGAVTNEPGKPRLSNRERLVVAAAVLLSIGAYVAVVRSLHIDLLGGFKSEREDAIATHAGRTALWATAAPFCTWATLRGGRRAWIAVAVWISLLVIAMPWWFPALDVDGGQRPLWRAEGSTILWLLVGAGLGVGLYAARRIQAPSLRFAAAALAVLLVGGSGWTAQHLHAENRELTAFVRCVPLPRGRAELALLRNDALWRSLSAARTEGRYEVAACRARSGSTGETYVNRTLATGDDGTLFLEAVAEAESVGWLLTDTSCVSGSETMWRWQATFAKDADVGTLELDIEAAEYQEGVHVGMEVGPPAEESDPSTPRCWEGSANP